MTRPIALSTTVPKREVLRYLGYPRKRQPTARVAAVLEQLWPLALDLIEPRGAFRIIDQQEAARLQMPKPTEHLAIALCTIGAPLEQEAKQREARGRTLDALTLDAFGSAATEACADALELKISAEAHDRDRYTRVRISPGYGHWDVSNQRALIALLPAAALGVSLTESMMMIPRKSVSFAVRFATEPTARQRDRCSHCDQDDCAHRR